jgi:hypothetical protein
MVSGLERNDPPSTSELPILSNWEIASPDKKNRESKGERTKRVPNTIRHSRVSAMESGLERSDPQVRVSYQFFQTGRLLLPIKNRDPKSYRTKRVPNTIRHSRVSAMVSGLERSDPQVRVSYQFFQTGRLLLPIKNRDWGPFLQW